jgi:prevent-host-death family protein
MTMQEVNIKEARRNISRLLDEVVAGEEVVIIRRGKAIARLLPIAEEECAALHFPPRADLRAKLPLLDVPSAALIRELRDERG